VPRRLLYSLTACRRKPRLFTAMEVAGQERVAASTRDEPLLLRLHGYQKKERAQKRDELYLISAGGGKNESLKKKKGRVGGGGVLPPALLLSRERGEKEVCESSLSPGRREKNCKERAKKKRTVVAVPLFSGPKGGPASPLFSRKEGGRAAPSSGVPEKKKSTLTPSSYPKEGGGKNARHERTTLCWRRRADFKGGEKKGRHVEFQEEGRAAVDRFPRDRKVKGPREAEKEKGAPGLPLRCP